MPRKRAVSSDTSNKTFPTRLRQLMKSSTPPVTQDTLAEAIGVKRQTISNYMNGQSSPDWETLVKITDFFHISADYLLGLHDVPAPQADLQAVCKYTGLTASAIQEIAAIDLLSKTNNQEFNPLNALLNVKDRNLIHILFDNMFMSILIGSKVKKEDFNNVKDVDAETKKKLKEAGIGVVPINQMAEMYEYEAVRCLQWIIHDLQKEMEAHNG